MSTISYATAQHEARHVVASWWVGGRRVDSVRVGSHADEDGIMDSSLDGRDLNGGDVIVSLVGWLDDPDLPPRAIWPEPWQCARTRRRRSLSSFGTSA